MRSSPLHNYPPSQTAGLGRLDQGTNGRLPAAKKSASLRQHTLDYRPSQRHTGNVMAMSSEIFGLRYTPPRVSNPRSSALVPRPEELAMPAKNSLAVPLSPLPDVPIFQCRSVVLQISICNAICNSFSRHSCGL